LGERVLCKHEVVGSIPIASTRQPAALADGSFILGEFRNSDAGGPPGALRFVRCCLTVWIGILVVRGFGPFGRLGYGWAFSERHGALLPGLEIESDVFCVGGLWLRGSLARGCRRLRRFAVAKRLSRLAALRWQSREGLLPGRDGFRWIKRFKGIW
jgi:hypothetical protein